MIWQQLRLSVLSCLQLVATATATASLVILPQPYRLSDVSGGQREAPVISRFFRTINSIATANTDTLVMLWQSERSSDESWLHLVTILTTALSPTVRDHLRRLTCLRSARAARAASRKALLKCAFETSSASGFPAVSASWTRSSLGSPASFSPISTG